MLNKLDLYDTAGNWITDSYCDDFTEYFNREVVSVEVLTLATGEMRIIVTLED